MTSARTSAAAVFFDLAPRPDKSPARLHGLPVARPARRRRVAAAARARRRQLSDRRPVLAERTRARERPRSARERHPHPARVHGLARHAFHGGVRGRAGVERPRARVAAALPRHRGGRSGVAARAVRRRDAGRRLVAVRDAHAARPGAPIRTLVWTDITSRYLRIVPHPELPWWAMRVQLASDPGYMVNYGLGAVLTAEMRAAHDRRRSAPSMRAMQRWYGWISERLLQLRLGARHAVADVWPAGTPGAARRVARPGPTLLAGALSARGASPPRAPARVKRDSSPRSPS